MNTIKTIYLIDQTTENYIEIFDYRNNGGDLQLIIKLDKKEVFGVYDFNVMKKWVISTLQRIPHTHFTHKQVWEDVKKRLKLIEGSDIFLS